MGILSDQVSY